MASNEKPGILKPDPPDETDVQTDTDVHTIALDTDDL